MAAATNRWGQSFKKGDAVEWRSGSGILYSGRYVKLAKADDYSRAYGKQAIVDVGGHETEVGLNDLRLVKTAGVSGYDGCACPAPVGLGAAAPVAPSATAVFEVVKGSTALGLRKGQRASVRALVVSGMGVRVDGFPARRLWFAGSRTGVPTLSYGREYNLHAGDPTQNVRIKVVG